MKINLSDVLPIKNRQSDISPLDKQDKINFAGLVDNNINLMPNISSEPLEEPFIPAKNPQELIKQIKSYQWLSDDAEELIDKSGHILLKKFDCKIISAFLYKLDKLSDEYKKRIKVSDILYSYERSGRYKKSVDNFNPNQYNKLLIGIQKKLPNVVETILSTSSMKWLIFSKKFQA